MSQLNSGIYAGVWYSVVQKEGKNYIAIQPEMLPMFVQNGANLKLLDDIGDGDPDKVMEALFASIPAKLGLTT